MIKQLKDTFTSIKVVWTQKLYTIQTARISICIIKHIICISTSDLTFSPDILCAFQLSNHVSQCETIRLWSAQHATANKNSLFIYVLCSLIRCWLWIVHLLDLDSCFRVCTEQRHSIPLGTIRVHAKTFSHNGIFSTVEFMTGPYVAFYIFYRAFSSRPASSTLSWTRWWQL